MRLPVPVPVLVYDGQCGFCRRWVARWRTRTGRRVLYLPFQGPFVLRLLGLSRADARRAVQLVEPGRHEVSRGATAVFRALLRAPELRLAARICLLPPVRWVAEWAYRRVVPRRAFAGRVDRLLFGTSKAPPRHQLARGIFLRALGGVYLIAFTSLGKQVLGLYGKRGILPTDQLLKRVGSHLGAERYLRLPTLLWLDASDETLVLVCRAGQVASGALLLGLWPRLSAFVLWALYLSLVNVGQDFLSFQWDVLLLETGALAVLAAPSGLAPGLGAAPPSWASVTLMRWLVFRLYLESGLAKLQSGDANWRKLTACRYYYETEPLPNRVGWYAHHLPARLQAFSTATVLAVECAAPLLVLGPRRLRRLGFWVFSGLQGIFALTGNYGFFNLLSFVLGGWLLDDEALGRRPAHPRPRVGRGRRSLREAAATLVAAPFFVLSTAELCRRIPRGREFISKLGPLGKGVRKLEGVTAPFHPVSSYGLFAMMTVERPEISIEGSKDGETWREYGFKYKPGNPSQPPRQVAPHQPRLDWQMWFAALSSPPAWFFSFLICLLEGSPEVLGLLQGNPFPDHPPRYVRAVLHDYRMASLEEHRRTGAWWVRRRVGLYVPPVALDRASPSAEGPFSASSKSPGPRPRLGRPR